MKIDQSRPNYARIITQLRHTQLGFFVAVKHKGFNTAFYSGKQFVAMRTYAPAYDYNFGLENVYYVNQTYTEII